MTTVHPRTPANPMYRPQVMRSKTNPPTMPQAPPRPTPMRARTFDEESAAGPWQQMAQTYAWVVEQEFVKMEKKNKKTGQWILEQQIFLDDLTSRSSGSNSTLQQRMWEEAVYAYEMEAERWMKHEELVRRRAAQREQEKARILQEDLRRIEARIRLKRDAEKRRLAEERQKANAALRDREKTERAKLDKATVDAWRNYEALWSALLTSQELLTFNTIPWPLVSSPSTPVAITPAGIIMFLFSPLHSQTQSRKDRIRSAQLRWHPDRFRRLMGRVAEQEKASVEEGVGIVARCLNDLMARETKVSHHPSTY